MKTPLVLCFGLDALASISPAAVSVTPTGIFVEGVIDRDLLLPYPFDGDTIDYLTFEVTTPGPVRLIGTGLRFSQFLAMGQDVGGGEPFDAPGIPYLLFRTINQMDPEFTHFLNPGLYLIQIAQAEFRDGDLYPYGYLPVNRSGGGFIASPDIFTLEGQFQALDFMEGNLDGTFTVTHVPEPSATALLGGVMRLLISPNGDAIERTALR